MYFYVARNATIEEESSGNGNEPDPNGNEYGSLETLFSAFGFPGTSAVDSPSSECM